MNSYKKLMANSFIFAIGNMGSKLISIILVPFYTYYLSTTQYGTVDLIMTTATMLLPIVSASIFEAVLRFIMDKEKSQKFVMTNTILIAIIGLLIAFSIYPILSFFNVFGNYLIFLYLILLLQIFERILAQYTRAIGKIKIFAINGILLTLATGLFNILFLAYFDFGMEGYFWGIIIANFISIIFMFIITKAYNDISFSLIDKTMIKELLVFSVPMIPNSLMWWLINASSRYFILIFVGVGANGLFAVASKVPSLINIINQIFTQAWQISAIEEYKNKNKSAFYTNVFTYLSSVLFIGSSVVIVLVKILFLSFFSATYYDAWIVVPFLLLGTIFSSFSAFLGTNYIVAKQTKGVFKTSVYGGLISLMLNVVFIPIFGIVGAGISSMISFFIIFIIRYYDTKKYINMEIKWTLFIKNLFIIFIQIGILLLSLPSSSELVIEVILLIILLLINRKIFKPLFENLDLSKLS